MAIDKKQIPLRLSSKLYDAIAAWAEDDFRSVNGQIGYSVLFCYIGYLFPSISNFISSGLT